MTGDVAADLRALVASAVAALPRVVEVMDQIDGAAPCQEPPTGSWQWTVSRRAYLAPAVQVDEVLRRLRATFPETDGWTTTLEDLRPPEARVQVRRNGVVLTLAVAAGPAPQVVVTAVSACRAGPA